MNNLPRLKFYNLQNNGIFSATWNEQTSTGTPGDPEDAVDAATESREDRDFDSVPGDEVKAFGTAPANDFSEWETDGAHGTFIYQQGVIVTTGFFSVKENAAAGGAPQPCVIAVLVIDP